MGKLATYWQEYRKTPAKSPRKLELQKMINDIEEWMIKQKYKKPGTKTDWATFKEAKIMPTKDKYGEFVGPAHYEHDVRTGYKRCAACRYNKNPNCCKTCHDSGAQPQWCHV